MNSPWRIKKSETTLVSLLHSCRESEYLYAAVFGGGRAKGTLKILQELLNHGGLVAVVRAGITYLTSKCPAGAGSPFRILFHDRTLNHASVAFNDIVRAYSSTLILFRKDIFFDSLYPCLEMLPPRSGSVLQCRLILGRYWVIGIFSRVR